MTFNQQVELLEQRGVKFDDKKAAEHTLRNFSYYGLVNGYRDFFILPKAGPTEEDNFNGCSFNDLVLMYDFDKKLGSILISYLLKIECSLGNVLSYNIAKEIGFLESEYYDKLKYNKGREFRDGAGVIIEYQIDKTFRHLDETRKSDYSQPIKHYREEHLNIPPWILIPELDFGKTIYFYDLCKAKEKILVTDDFLFDDRKANPDDRKELFKSCLLICADYRNTIAHGSRVINHVPDNKPLFRNSLFKYINTNVYDEKMYDSGIGKEGIISLLISMNIIFSKMQTNRLGFISEITSHFNKFKIEHNDLYSRISKKIKIPDHLTDFLYNLVDKP